MKCLSETEKSIKKKLSENPLDEEDLKQRYFVKNAARVKKKTNQSSGGRKRFFEAPF